MVTNPSDLTAPLKLREIRGMMYARGISLKDVAARAGCSHSTVRVVMSGHGKSRPIQRVVAEMLGIPYRELWGKNNHHRRAA